MKLIMTIEVELSEGIKTFLDTDRDAFEKMIFGKENSVDMENYNYRLGIITKVGSIDYIEHEIKP